MTSLKEIIENFKGIRVMVIGDVMLDHYIYGRVSRISPEAPVPVVEVTHEKFNPGGAANVAGNISCMGGSPILVGVVGTDNYSEKFIELIKKIGIDTSGIVRDVERPTTVKTRVVAEHQQVVRIDNENTSLINKYIKNSIMEIIKENIKSVQAIIFEDYDKGTIDNELIEFVVNLAKDYGKIVTSDPKYRNLKHYKGITLVKPNRKEAEWALKEKLTEENLEKLGKKLRQELGCDALLITLGKDGMALFTEDEFERIRNRPVEVYDVAGAGDTAIAAVTLALASGADFAVAAHIANIAAGIKVGKPGAVPVTYGELIQVVTKIVDDSKGNL